MPPTVVVTEPEFRRAERAFANAPGVRTVPVPADEPELADAIERSGARLAIVGHRPYRDRLYAVLPRGGVLARFGVGHDGIDKAKATAAGILCTNTPGVLDQSVAELTMLLVMAGARHLPTLHGDFVRGAWAQREGTELREKTLAIIGCGRIGRAVAHIARGGFGMRVVGFHRRPAAADVETLAAFDTLFDNFHAAVEHADFVSLHIPASPANLRFVDEARLRACPRRAWLINTARGAVVDEAALYDALHAGRLAGAALDVFDREPYEPIPGHDLRTLPNVVLIPHVGSHTVDSNRRMAERALQNVALGAAGQYAAMDLLNPEVVESIKDQP